MEPGLLILLIPVLILLILYLLPELLRWLSRRNRQQAAKLEASLADIGETLRTFAARLRPYRDLQADTFRRHYEPARDRLQQAVDTYQRLSHRLTSTAPPDRPYGLWAFAYLLNHPQEIWQVPACAVRLSQLGREIDKLRAGLGHAEERIARAEETPGGLVQSVRQLREQRLGKLAETLAEEKEAGLATAEVLQNRLSQIQRQTDMLLDTVQNGPATGLGRMDTLASELDQLEEATTALESDAASLRRRRRDVQARLDEIAAARQAITESAGDDLVGDSLEPLLDNVDALEAEARRLQRGERFEEAEGRALEALDLLQLTGELSTAANNVRALQQAAANSLQGEGIDALARRLHTTFRAAYGLYDATRDAGLSSPASAKNNGDSQAAGAPDPPPGDRRHEALKGLRLRANQLAEEAQQLLQKHEQDVQRLTQEAEQQAAQLDEAWQTLQQTVSLPAGDPVRNHYRSLQTQQAQAGADPLKLETYVDEARTLSTELVTATETIGHGFSRLETLRAELPAMLERAESEAHNWRCLQPLLLEMKDAIATLWQIGGSDVHLAEMQATLSEIETLEEQVRAAHAALDGERRRLAVLERRIMQTVQSQTLRRSPSGEKTDIADRSDLRARVESRLAAARGADTIPRAHGALRETIDWLEETRA